MNVFFMRGHRINWSLSDWIWIGVGTRSRGLIGLWLISVGGNPSSGKTPHHHFPIIDFTTNSPINSALNFIFNCGRNWKPSPNRIGWIDYWAISSMEKITTCPLDY